GPREVHLSRGSALEPALLQHLADVARGQHGQAGVGVRRRELPAGQVVQVQVQGGQEALQVRVLEDAELHRAVLQAGERPRVGVETAGRDRQSGPLEGRGEVRGGPGVHGERALERALVPQQVRLLRRQLGAVDRAGRDLGYVEAAAEYRHRAVVAGLDVAGSRGRDEDHDLSAARYERLDLV